MLRGVATQALSMAFQNGPVGEPLVGQKAAGLGERNKETLTFTGEARALHSSLARVRPEPWLDSFLIPSQ